MPPDPVPATMGEGTPSERVFSEIRHELGNRFHRLFYFAEDVAERCAGVDPVAARSAAHLAETLRGLETFLRSAFEFAQPVRIDPLSMGAGELVAALVARAEGLCDGARVTLDAPPCWDGARLHVDPVRFPAAVDVAVEAARGAGDVRVQARARVRNGRRGLELRLLGAGAGTVVDEAGALVRWASAERVVSEHGGVLAREDGEPPAIVLFVPLQA
jgi:hypothetical protein